MEVPLKREFDFYLAHQAELVKDHNGKYVVIKDQKVVGVYDDQASALSETVKNHDLGSFLVQKVEPGEQSHTQVFHSRVAFA
jgi:hypothetical protein